MLQNNGHIMVHFIYIINVTLFLITMWPQWVFMTLEWTGCELLMLFDDAKHYCWPGSSYLGSHFRILYIVKAFHQIQSAAWACTSETASLLCLKGRVNELWNICWIKLWLHQWIHYCLGMWIWQTVRLCKKNKKERKKNVYNERNLLWIWQNSTFFLQSKNSQDGHEKSATTRRHGFNLENRLAWFMISTVKRWFGELEPSSFGLCGCQVPLLGAPTFHHTGKVQLSALS